MLKNKKILCLLIVLLIIIITGGILLFVKGVNYSLIYGEHTTVELYLETDFESADVQNIIKEVFGNQTKTREVNNLNYDILIITKSASDEQLNNLISKINEKYNLELTTNDLLVTNNAKIDVMDLIMPYILPICIASALILFYFIIRYKKLGISKVILFTIFTVILVQLVYASIYSIARLPVNEYTMPISMMLYLITIIAIIEKFDIDLQKSKEE